MTKFVNTISLIVIFLIVGSWLAFNMLLVRVPVGYVGVRTQQYAVLGEKGVKKEDFGPGWHRDLGPIDSWVLFDSTVQTLELTRRVDRGSRQGRDDVQIVSADGNRVSVDLTLKYRIKPGAAFQLYQNIGPDDAYKGIVRNESLDTFRIAYGELKTEDFYDPVKRDARTSAAVTLIRRKLEPRNIEVLDVLVRDVMFEPGYERKIREKKLADQDVELNKSLANAAEMQGITKRIIAETGAMVKVINSQKEAELLTMRAEADKQVAQIKAEAEKYATETRADADLFAAELEAKGTLLEREAEAEGELLKAQALQGSGGANYVARIAAENINLREVTVSSADTPFLDLESMARRLGAGE